jgi:hypothetical protein
MDIEIDTFIYFDKLINRYKFAYLILGVQKRFQFLDDAIIFRDIFCYENDIDID